MGGPAADGRQLVGGPPVLRVDREGALEEGGALGVGLGDAGAPEEGFLVRAVAREDAVEELAGGFVVAAAGGGEGAVQGGELHHLPKLGPPPLTRGPEVLPVRLEGGGGT